MERDIQAGVIPHGLDIAFDYSVLGGAGSGGPGAELPPAVANDDGSGPGPLADGALLLIPAGTTKPATLSAGGSALWDAAATYGVYITDQLGGLARVLRGRERSRDQRPFGQRLHDRGQSPPHGHELVSLPT